MPEAFHILADGSKATTIHFIYRAPVGLAEQKGSSLNGSERTEWRVACAPLALLDRSRTPNEAPWLRSDDARAVTCPLCRESRAFQVALAAIEEIMEAYNRKRRRR